MLTHFSPIIFLFDLLQEQTNGALALSQVGPEQTGCATKERPRHDSWPRRGSSQRRTAGFPGRAARQAPGRDLHLRKQSGSFVCGGVCSLTAEQWEGLRSRRKTVRTAPSGWPGRRWQKMFVVNRGGILWVDSDEGRGAAAEIGSGGAGGENPRPED